MFPLHLDNLVKHLALGHSKLDELLQNEELVAAKRAKAMSKPKKVSVGPSCPVCDTRDPTRYLIIFLFIDIATNSPSVSREHVSRHFGDELMVYISEFEDPCACNECDYRGEKPKSLAIRK